jgi:hypothetical protein
MVEMSQRFLLPFLPASEVAERVSAAEASGLAAQAEIDGDRRYEPIQALHDLELGYPEFFEDREARLLAAESELFERLRDGDPPGERSYLLRQRIEVRRDELPAFGALLLWLPVPRHIPGIQSVRLVRCEPSAVADFHVREAGQLYRVPLLLSPDAPPPPVLSLEFEVTQAVANLVGLHDPDLVPLDRRAREESVVSAWLDDVEISPELAPEQQVGQLLDAMEAAFQSTPYDPLPLRFLVEVGAGSVPTLTTFLSVALEQLWFATRMGAAQPAFMAGDEVVLSFPGSFAYEHRFLHWVHTRTGTYGTTDLTYFQRWGSSATKANTRRRGLRSKLNAIGDLARPFLRRGIYPGDTVLAGAAPPSYFVNLNSGERTVELAPVDTQISFSRLAGD